MYYTCKPKTEISIKFLSTIVSIYLLKRNGYLFFFSFFVFNKKESRNLLFMVEDFKFHISIHSYLTANYYFNTPSFF